MNSSTRCKSVVLISRRPRSNLTSLIVLLVCLVIVASRVHLNRFLHRLDRSAQEVRVTHGGELRPQGRVDG